MSERAVLTGWGRTPASSAWVDRPTTAAELAKALAEPPPRGVVARGLGRSYGDMAQNGGGLVIDCTGVSGLVDVDLQAGIATALAGTSLADLMRWLVPLGYFVPVTPGTRHVTVGGAIANDIHGKNHHRAGSWCDHVLSLTLVTPADGIRTVRPEDDPELFWATAGGLGLTGIVVDATFSLHPIETSILTVDTVRAADLDEVMAEMEAGDHAYDYSVAWIDLMATGRQLGRSLLDRGRFATCDELDDVDDPLAFRPRSVATAPPVVPPRLLNRWTVRAFNELWFRKAPRRRTGHHQSISQYFHPLDLVEGWNRLYGPHGFLQWQSVVPFGAEDALRRCVEALSTAGCTSFLAVLKRFGPGNAGPLSFPLPGWTLALDIPADDPRAGPVLDQLDRDVADAGGRVYLAKDSRLASELVEPMYPRLDEWRAVRERVDPQRVLRSDLARRLCLG